MARYRKVMVAIWNCRDFAGMSDNAKLLYLYLLTCQYLTSLGAMRATIPGLAADMRWTEEAFREAFTEAFRKGFVEADERACYVGIPRFLEDNRPESPNVVKSWDSQLELIPDCDLKTQLVKRVKAFVEALPKGFREALPEAFRKGMPNPEPYPEPKPEPKPPPTPASADRPEGWVVVVDELIRLGSGAADAVVADARKAGWSPEGAMALLAYWQEHCRSEGWGIGLAAHALGRPPRPPVECLTLVRTAKKPADTRGEHAALQQFELRRQDEIRRKATEEADRQIAARLEQFGLMIDGWTIEERQALLSDDWSKKEAAIRGDAWRDSRLLCKALLTAAEQAQQEVAA